MKTPRKRRGFTLIELMIGIAIIGVLAAIAIPLYFKFTLRSKQVEATTMMGMIRNQQWAHYSAHECFVATNPSPSTGVPGPATADWDAVPTGPADACAQPQSFADIGVVPHRRSVYFVYECVQSNVPPEFTCNARGDLDGDGQIYEMVLCTDNNNDNITLASPAGTACTFPWEPVRVSQALF